MAEIRYQQVLGIAAATILNPALGSSVLLSKILEGKSSDSEEAAQATEAAMKLLERRAGVIRELAIARRIDCAEKVSIEEYYDTKGDGHAGIKVEEKDNISVGLGGSGERVVKRIYTLEGWGKNDGLGEGLMKIFQEIDIDKERSVIEEQS